MAENLVVREPIFLEDHGRRVAVILPIDDYESFRAWAQAQREAQEALSGFEREKAAFERIKPELERQYPGKCVAVVGGKVVKVGDDKVQVIDSVHKQFGRVSMYVQWVTSQPHIYHFPYRQVAKT